MPRGLTLLAVAAAVVATAGCGGLPAAHRLSPGGPAPRPTRRFAVLHAPGGRIVARRVPVAILTYHRVAHLSLELVSSLPDETVEPVSFFTELEALKRSGFHTISQRELFEALVRGAPLPKRSVMLTVDDGYVDDVRRILPELQFFHFRATFYVITGRIHRHGFLNAGEIRQLDAAGMDIGAHTRHHVPLAALTRQQAHDEIFGSRDDLERILGHPVYWFAYPFGSVDAEVQNQVRAAGFLTAVTTQAGRLPSSTALLDLPRIHVGRLTTPESVVAMATAG